MNIEGANLLSSPPVNSAIDGGGQPFPENGAAPDVFSNALMGQIELLSEANSQAVLPGSLPSTAVSQSMGDLLTQKGTKEELASFIDNLSYKKNEPVTLNEDVDLEATLLALTDALKAMTPGSDAINPAATPEEAATAQDVSLALTDALKAITPSIGIDEAATMQNRSEVMAFNGLSFAKPLPEEAELNRPGKDEVISSDFLQKETVLRQPSQDKQGFNLPYAGNAESFEKTLMLKEQAALSGIEKASPGATADMFTLPRTVDNRTESPAITKPLTHPGWSKDLGEQIVWMNNKTISAAEIKLNPAHLGPISVRIDINQDQATIAFTALHAEVKDAIEASIPKLREMLGTQQLNLTNVNISQNATPDQGRSQQQTFARTPENREQDSDGVTGTLEKIEHERMVVNKGLLSLYA
jgi:flagellar hook-length control protein FliK